MTRIMLEKFSRHTRERMEGASFVTLHEAQRVCDIYGYYELHPHLSRGNWDGNLFVVTQRQVDVLMSVFQHFLIKCRQDEIIRHVTTLIECVPQISILICWGRLIRVAVKISSTHSPPLGCNCIQDALIDFLDPLCQAKLFLEKNSWPS